MNEEREDPIKLQPSDELKSPFATEMRVLAGCC